MNQFLPRYQIARVKNIFKRRILNKIKKKKGGIIRAYEAVKGFPRRKLAWMKGE